MEEASDKDSDLENIGSDEEVEANRSPAVRLQEDHKEAETNEDHHVNILEDRVEGLHLVGRIKTSGIR